MAEKERIHSTIGPTGMQVARSVRRFREARGLTTERMASLLTDMGVPLQASAITRIEKGQRRVSVDELVALAHVLNVNVAALLLPVEVDRERPVEITAHGEVPAARAWQWADGRKPLPGHGTGPEDIEGFNTATRPWWLRREHVEPSDATKFQDRLYASAQRDFGSDRVNRRDDGTPEITITQRKDTD